MKKKYFTVQTRFSKKQNSDAGMAATLILLLIGFFTGNVLFYKIAIPILVINMIFPGIFYPFSVFWYNLSSILGAVVSRILLSLVFFLFVIPVGIVRRMAGKDSLHLKNWNKSKQSALKIRDHEFSAADLTNPF